MMSFNWESLRLLIFFFITIHVFPHGSNISSLSDVEWRIPIGCDFSGFFVEVVLGYIPFLVDQNVPIKLLQGRCPDRFLESKLTLREADIYRRVQVEDHDRSEIQTSRSIVIEHAEPCKMRKFRKGFEPLYIISRTMSEGLVDQAQIKCLNTQRVDEIWLPTEWHRTAFSSSGLKYINRVKIIPESVDVNFFSPWHDFSMGCDPSGICSKVPRSHFKFVKKKGYSFLSVFKWEIRKGWDILLEAYWSEFGIEDDVELVLRTYRPFWEPGPKDLNIELQRQASKFKSTLEELPAIRLIQEELSRTQMRQLYANADAFVLPTRGEGWGLPVMEAMAMELPVIVTYYSGPTAYLNRFNGYLLKYNAVRKNLMAEPDVQHLRRLMRRVYRKRVDARIRGERARRDIINNFHPTKIAHQIKNRLLNITHTINNK